MSERSEAKTVYPLTQEERLMCALGSALGFTSEDVAGDIYADGDAPVPAALVRLVDECMEGEDWKLPEDQHRDGGPWL